MKKKIVVVGSSNTDLVIQTSHFPVPGETVIGGVFNTFAGGKGANQAVAAARLGAEVTFVARVGSDGFGKEAVQGFKKDEINTDFVFHDAKHPTGVATIILNEIGENTIVVAPGANNELCEADILKAENKIKEAEVVLVQLEILLKTVRFTVALAHKLKKMVILNPAPAVDLPDAIYKEIDLITPNETEAAILVGVTVNNFKTASKAASRFLDKGVKNVIITLGAKGAFFKNANTEFLVPALKTDVIDTTAAGDIFNGALAVALSEGKSWKDTLIFANAASSIGVSRLGAQASVPFRKEVESIL
jgi:ribokinase